MDSGTPTAAAHARRAAAAAMNRALPPNQPLLLQSPVLPLRAAVTVFLAFAFAYFLSALVRAVTATLAPVLVQEFALQARDLGLLAGGYFLGFAATQLPLGSWLDRHGPKKVLLGFLCVAVVGSLVFSVASGFSGLLAGRLLCGAGLSACLMAPLTGYRRWFAPATQLRANAWMLMTGSLGTVASTLPVQQALPLVGWRPLFWALALLLALAIAAIALWVPDWGRGANPCQPDVANANGPGASAPVSSPPGYAMVWRHRYFRRLAPLGFFCYGGLLAIQTLWAGPWLQHVAGYSALEAATGLFWINVCMLCAFWVWGVLNPWLQRRGLAADRLMAWGLPLPLLVLAAIIAAGPRAGAAAWALFCVSSSFVTLSQPALALAFPQALAGRALTAYNLLIFSGVFALQWGIGLALDGFAAAGWSSVTAYRAAMALFLLCNAASWGWMVRCARRDNARPAPA